MWCVCVYAKVLDVKLEALFVVVQTPYVGELVKDDVLGIMRKTFVTAYCKTSATVNLAKVLMQHGYRHHNNRHMEATRW